MNMPNVDATSGSTAEQTILPFQAQACFNTHYLDGFLQVVIIIRGKYVPNPNIHKCGVKFIMRNLINQLGGTLFQLKFGNILGS
jgi:hypothetical protein